MKTKQIIAYNYIADDGQEFLTEEDCLKYEATQKNVLAFKVHHNVDLTESGRLDSCSFILVNCPDPYYAQKFVRHYCFKKFGNEIAFVQGVYGGNAICDAWVIKSCLLSAVEPEKILAKIQPKFVDAIWDKDDPLVISKESLGTTTMPHGQIQFPVIIHQPLGDNMKSNIVRMKGNVSFSQLYTCSVCGVEDEGTTQSMEITSPDCFNNLKLAPYGMPFGWGSYYGERGTFYKCHNCTVNKMLDKSSSQL
jgi:DNA-directed RNA polymerase subunit RPC12/RpoP